MHGSTPPRRFRRESLCQIVFGRDRGSPLQRSIELKLLNTFGIRGWYREMHGGMGLWVGPPSPIPQPHPPSLHPPHPPIPHPHPPRLALGLIATIFPWLYPCTRALWTGDLKKRAPKKPDAISWSALQLQSFGDDGMLCMV